MWKAAGHSEALDREKEIKTKYGPAKFEEIQNVSRDLSGKISNFSSHFNIFSTLLGSYSLTIESSSSGLFDVAAVDSGKSSTECVQREMKNREYFQNLSNDQQVWPSTHFFQ